MNSNLRIIKHSLGREAGSHGRGQPAVGGARQPSSRRRAATGQRLSEADGFVPSWSAGTSAWEAWRRTASWSETDGFVASLGAWDVRRGWTAATERQQGRAAVPPARCDRRLQRSASAAAAPSRIGEGRAANPLRMMLRLQLSKPEGSGAWTSRPGGSASYWAVGAAYWAESCYSLRISRILGGVWVPTGHNWASPLGVLCVYCVLLHYFSSTFQQCFPIIINQYKHQYKPNFS